MKLKEIPISFYHTQRLKAMNSHSLKKKNGDELPVIVSLTSIPSRLSKVHITLRSILCQPQKPEKIVLWLHDDLKAQVPNSLKKLYGEIFEVRFTHLKCSHKKLVHSLKAFPDPPIITCDDDCIYRKNWLSSLYQTHLKNPENIIAHRLRCIQFSETGETLPYKKWICHGNENPRSFLPIGAEGVLYPPHIFPKLVWDEALFLKLTPTADDLWFKVISLKENILPKKSENSPMESIPVMGTQKVSLKKANIDEDQNRVQWDNLSRYFDLKI